VPAAYLDIEEGAGGSVSMILEKTAQALNLNDVANLTIPVEGLTVEMIRKIAREKEYDLIVLAVERSTRFERFLHSDPAYGLCGDPPCPVLIV
jgi:nucleotide-binding universal stress UspA family protein